MTPEIGKKYYIQYASGRAKVAKCIAHCVLGSASVMRPEWSDTEVVLHGQIVCEVPSLLQRIRRLVFP
jgi:hypothetical protein